MRVLSRVTGDTIHIQKVSGDSPQKLKNISSGGGAGIILKYTGEYEVTPRTDEAVVLETAARLMTRDVTVNKIPYFKVANESGNTIYIGSEV